MPEDVRAGNDTRIPFRMHPRVFKALGADLVTSDIVALVELVKNSYDAFASRVDIRFMTGPGNDAYIEIDDDGEGMTVEIIDDVWCVVATPFKETHPEARSGRRTRRVAGDKGLGRLSSARLGDRLLMHTQAKGGTCWEVEVDWSAVFGADNMGSCTVVRRKYSGVPIFGSSGTRIQIFGPKNWTSSELEELEENLARLLSPFEVADDFSIRFRAPGESSDRPVSRETQAFLKRPKYSIEGRADRKGDIECHYRFTPIKEGKPRTHRVRLTWKQAMDSVRGPDREKRDRNGPECGPFSFDIRAWDISSDDAAEIAEEFELKKTSIRKAITAHKGISVYRDRILVLPKSEKTRDWLGLDLRRVSRVGARLSTSQLVGYVAISAKANPHIADTSDRERLAESRAVEDLTDLLVAIVRLMEAERSIDRTPRGRERPLRDLLSSLSADKVISDVSEMAAAGAGASEAVPVLQTFNAELAETKKTIEERFVHYSRLATVGTIAQMLVHEIRNRTTALGHFLRGLKDHIGPSGDADLTAGHRIASGAVDALERLADTFSPLASRSFRRRQREAILEERIARCIEMTEGDIRREGVRVSVPDTRTPVAADPGEVDSILLNLITNSLYWLGQAPKDKRIIEVRLSMIDGARRVRVWFHDSGPGIAEEDVDKVFWPGVTRKPDGIGMGLTVASELVAEYGGRMTIKHPGLLGGASLAFDLPASARAGRRR